MAGSTEHYNLIKPADNDPADNTPLNTNFDRIDSALAAHDDALAIVANGNTHAAITSGQFVYVRNHETLANGLYTANSNIAANATLSSSNLTADSSGGLNALYSNLANKYVTEKVVIDGSSIAANTTDVLEKSYTPPTGYVIDHINIAYSGNYNAVWVGCGYNETSGKIQAIVRNVSSSAILPNPQIFAICKKV